MGAGREEATRAVPAQPAPKTETVSVKFGAMPIGSSWYIYAATITKLLEEVFPAGSIFEVVPTGGVIANPLMVQERKADIALSNAATSRWAYDGIEMYEGRESKDIRGIAGRLAGIWMARMFSKDFIRRTGMDSIEQIVEAKYPVRLMLKPEGSTVSPTARLILDMYDASFDTIKEWGAVIRVFGGQIPSMMRDGRADVWLESVAVGHPATVEGMMTANLRMVGITDREIRYLADFGFEADVIPANTFANQPVDLKSVNPGTTIIASAHVPNEIAYEVARILSERTDVLVEVHASIRDFEPEKAWLPERNAIPLHPGVEQYYRERGWMK